jgi:hypothetical protein
MPRPLSKDQLAVLRTLARAQPSDTPPDETIVAHLAKAGLVTQRRGRFKVTEAGQAELDKRKVAGNGAAAPAAGDA